MTQQRFNKAIHAWLENVEETDQAKKTDLFLENWSTGNSILWTYPRKLAREGESLPDDSLEKIRIALNESKQESFIINERLFNLVPSTDELSKDECEQVFNLVRGILNGILASSRLMGWKPENNHDDFAEAWDAIAKCFACYHAAWDLKSPPVKAVAGNAAADPNSSQATAILDQFGNIKNPEDKPWWTESNWLLVRRLLSYLMGEEKTDEEENNLLTTNKIHMLLVSGPDTDGNYKGATAPVTTTATKEGRCCAYLDPVALGVTVLDEAMLRSLQIASKACHPLLIENQQSIRISPDLSGLPGIWQLEGGSAGGIITLTTCATGLGIRLNQTATASFTVDVDDEKLNDEKHQLTIDEIQFGAVGKESIAAKLQRNVLNSATTQTGEELKTIYLHHTQKCCLNGGPAREWNEWVNVVSGESQITIEKVDQNTTLSTLIHEMSGNERMEKQLDKYCQCAIDEWGELTTTPGNDEAELEHYISPWFSRAINPQEKKLEDTSENRKLEEQYQPLCEPTDSETIKFSSLFQMDALANNNTLKSRRIVLTEDAGAGKSVFSRALKRWLSSPEGRETLFNGSPCLVVRWERGTHSWPEKTDANTLGEDIYLQHLVREVQATNEISEQEAIKIVEYAMERGRIVFILDAFDQLAGNSKAGQINAFRELVEASKKHHFRIIVTSRAKPVESLRTEEGLFSWQTWSFVKINGFTPFQQLVYLKGLVESLVGFVDDETKQTWDDFFKPFNSQGEYKESVVPQNEENEESSIDETAIGYLRQIFKDVYDEVQELLEVPAILKFIRFLCRAQKKFPEFANRADLYFQATDYIFERNLGKDARYADHIPQYKDYFREILAAAAYQMMVMNAQAYAVENDLVTELEAQTKARISNKNVIEGWKELWEAMQSMAGLTNHLILEDKTNDYFGFKHKGMMEFYAGLFLAKNSQKDWEEECQIEYAGQNSSSLIENSADPNWEWAFRFAVELVESTKTAAKIYGNNKQRIPSLCALFAPKKKEENLRPTKLMFRVWQILKRNDDTLEIKICLDDLLTSYRSTFRQILLERDEKGEPAQRALRAAELVHEDDLISLVTDTHRAQFNSLSIQLRPFSGIEYPNLEELNQKVTLEGEYNWLRNLDKENWVIKITPPHKSYSFCADPEKDSQNGSQNHLTFMMGVPREDDDAFEDEKPWQMVRVKAFYMAACCVTRAQYQLFDPNLEKKFKSDFERVSPEEDCPVIETNWFDGFCLGLWLGEQYRLPSEFEWEGAAWGGIDRWEKENRKRQYSVPYKGSISIEEINYNNELSRTLPVRWDQQRYEKCQNDEIKKKTNGPYNHNGFDLYHMNGNVWEWSSSVWDGELLKKRIVEVYQLELEGLEAEMNSKQAWLERVEAIGTGQENNPEPGQASSDRSLRGGSWSGNAKIIRASIRDDRYVPVDRSTNVGLRVLRTK